MANAITPASIDDLFQTTWEDDDWSVLAVDDSYSPGTDDVLSDVAGGVRLGIQLLGSRTFTGAVGSAAPSLIPTPGGDQLGGFWIFKDTGTESTSRLMLWIDTNADGTAIGGTTSSDGIAVPWSSTGIFRVAAIGA